MEGEGKRTDMHRMFRMAAVIAIVAILLAGWWFIRSAILYDGDFLGLRTTDKYGGNVCTAGIPSVRTADAISSGLVMAPDVIYFRLAENITDQLYWNIKDLRLESDGQGLSGDWNTFSCWNHWLSGRRVEKKNIFVRQTAAYHISDMHGNSMRIEYLLFFL